MTVHCYAALQEKGPLFSHEYEQSSLGPWDVEVAITHCGICYTDIHFIDNDMGNSKYPLIPGHEIVGTIIKTGALVDPARMGTRVGIGFQRSSCMACEWCNSGKENVCPEQKATCLHHPGGFGDKIVIDSRFAFAIPDALLSEEAAPLLCAGATVFQPMIDHGVAPLKKVGVIGIGGLGHLALQFARAFGCEVTAFTSSASKIEEAKLFGAHHVAVLSDENEMKKMTGKLDFILSTVSADLDWNGLLKVLRPLGVLCFVGQLEKPINIYFKNLIRGCKTITVSSIGNRPGIQEMLKFAALHKIKPKIELFPITQINEAIQKVRNNAVRYRAVLYI